MQKMSAAIVVLLIPFLATPVSPQTTFTKIRVGDIVNDAGISHAAAWADYDNDGWLDLYVGNEAPGVDPRDSFNFLYRNDGDPGGTGQVTFTPINSSPIASDGGNVRAATWGDFNNDGWLDLFVATGTGLGDGFAENFLYKNNGSPAGLGAVTFAPVTSGDIVSNVGNNHGCSWGDFNNDGWLDLFVANSGRNFLYLNDGDPGATGRVTFTRHQLREPFIDDILTTVTGIGGDFDNDGDLDLFVANNEDNEGGQLFQNNGNFDGSGPLFTKITSGAVASEGGHALGGSWGDYDNDGDLDLVVIKEIPYLFENLVDEAGIGQVDFRRVALDVPSGGEDRFNGSSWVDYDNDGDLDLFVNNTGSSSHLYRNDGDVDGSGQVTFRYTSDSGIDSDVAELRACSWGDYTNDGFPDLFVANGSLIQGSQDNFLYQNNGNGNHWIQVKCIGTFSNRAAIGAKVRIKAVISGRAVWQMREISGQTGYHAQNSLNAEFGLGNATVVDSIVVEWPSGIRQFVTQAAVDQVLPIIEGVPVAAPEDLVAEAGQAINVRVDSPSNMISEINLNYRRAGGGAYVSMPMFPQGGGQYGATIPADWVTAGGIEYRLAVKDNGGRRAWWPTSLGHIAIRVHVPDGLTEAQPRPYGSSQQAYRLFSVPLDLDDKRPEALLIDDLGEYDQTRWRFLGYDPVASATIEFADIHAIEPGSAYWFLVSEPARVIDTGAGTSVSTAEPFAIPLSVGWNLVGNPFYFPIPAANLRLASGITVVLRSHVDQWNNPLFDPVMEILPFDGYAINSPGPDPDTLFINPDISAASVGKVSVPSQRLAGTTDRFSWAIRIEAQSQQARDEDNVLGVAPAAREGRDDLDFAEPPPVGQYVSVYFPHQAWGVRNERFCTDFRPVFTRGASWQLEVASNIQDRIMLSFEDLKTVPPEFEIWLVDEHLGVRQNLREDDRFTLASPGAGRTKALKLMIGAPDFLAEQNGYSAAIPATLELAQNFPNPFNPTTTIRYGLARPGRVTLKIYDLTGREIATLADLAQKPAGYHTAIWNGRNTVGRKVASGVYFIRLTSGKFVRTRKMVLVD